MLTYRLADYALTVCALVVAACMAAAQAQTSTTGLVGFWPMDEGKGTVVHDMSPSGNHGEVTAAEWAAGREGAALEFVGPKSFVKAPHHSKLNLTDAFTLAAWVCPTALSGSRVIVSKGREYWSSGYTFLLLGQHLCLLMKTAQRKRFWAAAQCPKLQPKVWAHVAAAYDAKAGKWQFYFNGDKIGEGATSGPVCYLPPDPGYPYPTLPLHIGCLAAYHNWQYEGLIRNLKVYNRALAPEEVRQEFQCTQSIALLDPETRARRLAKYLTAKLMGQIVDEKGRPVSVRVRAKATDGKCYGPKKLHYASGHFYAIDGRLEIKVPPGQVGVEVWHGPEYVPEVRTVQVKAGEPQSLSLALKRFVDMPSAGWYGGDHHIHYRTHGQILEDWTPTFAEACSVARAAGLHFASLKETIKNAPIAQEGFIAREDAFEGRSHRNVGGHVCWVNVAEQPNPDTFAFLEAQRLNAIGSHTHPAGMTGRVDNPKELMMARDMALAVPLGHVPIWDVFWGGNDAAWMPATWYRFLNLGFRLAGAGWSDTDLNLAHAGPPGTCRVYAKLDRLGWDKVVEAYRAGRTFVTNGPLLLLRVNGQDPGAVISLDTKASPLSVEVEAHAQSGVQRVEIVVNGKVAQTLPAAAAHVRQTTSLPVADTCWVAARCVAKRNPYFGCHAHTSPVYVQVGGRPMRPRQEDIDYFLKWLADYRKILPQLEKEPRMKTNFAEIRAYLGKAEAAYRALAANPRRWTD